YRRYPPPCCHSSLSLSDTEPLDIHALSPTRRSSDLNLFSEKRAITWWNELFGRISGTSMRAIRRGMRFRPFTLIRTANSLNERRSEEHTSELQSRFDLVCRLLLEKKKQNDN